MTPRRCAWTVLMTLGLAGTALGQAADQIVLIPGSAVKGPGGRVRGQVQSETPAEVKIGLGANTQAVPVDQIQSIVYGGQPASIALAESREAAGALADAADLYKKAIAEAGGKPFVVLACQFNQARLLSELALADPTKAAEATALLETFARVGSTSRHIAPALEALARLQLQKGDNDQAEQTVKKLAALPGGADRAAILKGRVLARKGDAEQAIKEFDAIIAAAPEGSAKRRGAQLAKAEGLASLKKYPEAEALLHEVIKASAPEDAPAQALAYNTLGDCLLAANQPKAALLAYLRTDILYSKDKEHHPRALAQIARLWRDLKRDDRADEVLERLKQEYPQSSYLSGAARR
jgi:tetratricopeptide (TPR) repeat protein